MCTLIRSLLAFASIVLFQLFIAEVLERLAADAMVKTALGSSPASSDTVEYK